MTYLELARKIKSAYKELKQNEAYKLFNVIWNNDLGESEITVENDAGFRAIIIGNTSGVKKSRGYMYLFYTNDDTVLESDRNSHPKASRINQSESDRNSQS